MAAAWKLLGCYRRGQGRAATGARGSHIHTRVCACAGVYVLARERGAGQVEDGGCERTRLGRCHGPWRTSVGRETTSGGGDGGDADRSDSESDTGANRAMAQTRRAEGAQVAARGSHGAGGLRQDRSGAASGGGVGSAGPWTAAAADDEGVGAANEGGRGGEA